MLEAVRRRRARHAAWICITPDASTTATSGADALVPVTLVGRAPLGTTVTAITVELVGTGAAADEVPLRTVVLEDESGRPAAMAGLPLRLAEGRRAHALIDFDRVGARLPDRVVSYRVRVTAERDGHLRSWWSGIGYFSTDPDLLRATSESRMNAWFLAASAAWPLC